MRRGFDIGATLAVAWLLVAVVMTVLIGPQLGLRGWIWLGVHHALCLVGSTHELWRSHRRLKGSRARP